MVTPDPDFLYKSFFDNTLDGVAYCQVFYDPSGRAIDLQYLVVNKNFEKLTGLKNVVGKRLTKVIPGIATSNPELFEIYGQVALTRRPARFETHIESLDSWFDVLAYSPEYNYIIAVFQNITDQKRIEKGFINSKIAARNVLEDLSIEKSNVERARAKEEAILLSIGDGLLATDVQGKITLINRAGEKLIGKPKENLIGKVFTEAIRVEDEDGKLVLFEDRPINMALSSSATVTTSNPSTSEPTYYYVRNDKFKFPVAITLTPVMFDGRLIGTIQVFRDITREKEVDKAKTEFVALASHQLRTPLSAVSWYAEMLLAGDVGELNSDQKKYADQIYQGNHRMVELVNALLNVSRLELGTFYIEPESANVAELVQNVITEEKLLIDQKHLTLTTVFDPNIPLTLVDPQLLHMVVQNILSNAVKYTPEKGTIEVGVRPVKRGSTLNTKKIDIDSLAIVVSDSGYGIPADQRHKVFDKLFRADNVREKDTEGTGLGLYIAKSIMDNSGGSIWFTSEEDHGTTFCVTLPLTGMKKKEGEKRLE